MNTSSATPNNDHDQPPQDEATRKKIEKHLSDENDTISEEDMKNINTSTGTDTTSLVKDREHDVREANEILQEKPDEDDEPNKEAPSPWEILNP